MLAGCRNKKVKVKAYIYNPDIPKLRLIGLHQSPKGIGTHSFTASFPWEEYTAFSAAEANHTVPISVNKTSSHYCGVARSGVDLKPKPFTHDQRRRNRTSDPFISGPTP